MLAIIIFLCGFLGLWINFYSLVAIALFSAYYFSPGTKIRFEVFLAYTGLILSALNFIMLAIIRIGN